MVYTKVNEGELCYIFIVNTYIASDGYIFSRQLMIKVTYGFSSVFMLFCVRQLVIKII